MPVKMFDLKINKLFYESIYFHRTQKADERKKFSLRTVALRIELSASKFIMPNYSVLILLTKV